MSRILIGLASLNQTPIDWDGNLKNIKSAIEAAKEKGLKILCLPELCLTGYGCEDIFLSNWLPVKALSLLPEITHSTYGICVTVGLPVKLHGRVYNCIAIIHDQKILGFYAKQQLANEGVHYETRWFTPWLKGDKKNIDIDGNSYPISDDTYDLYGYRIGIEICEDAWEEASRPAKDYHKKNVQIILNPSASHFAFGKALMRDELIIGSSERYQCVYAYANLLGNEAGRMIYDGETMIAQNGRLLLRNKLLVYYDFHLSFADIDLENDTNSSSGELAPRLDKYQEFSKATSLGLFDYMRKSKSLGFVLSLSGGADSSACAVMVGEMIRHGTNELGTIAFLQKIGRSEIIKELEHITKKEWLKFITSKLLAVVYQSTKNSSQDTLDSAKYLADSMGACFYSWRIDDEVNSYTTKIEEALKRKLTWRKDDITLQNIQARARSPAIWMLANIKNCLLITTSNRSEGDVGYATMDGDTSGSIAPIAAVDKYFILSWLKWAEVNLEYKELKLVNELSPTAELRPRSQEQTDENDLMPYYIIQAIERLSVRDRKSPVEVFKILENERLEERELLKKHIIKFYRLWSRNQWKRERIAPAFHIDDFNVDPKTWCRFPILSSGFKSELEELQNF